MGWVSVVPSAIGSEGCCRANALGFLAVPPFSAHRSRDHRPAGCVRAGQLPLSPQRSRDHRPAGRVRAGQLPLSPQSSALNAAGAGTPKHTGCWWQYHAAAPLYSEQSWCYPVNGWVNGVSICWTQQIFVCLCRKIDSQ